MASKCCEWHPDKIHPLLYIITGNGLNYNTQDKWHQNNKIQQPTVTTQVQNYIK